MAIPAVRRAAGVAVVFEKNRGDSAGRGFVGNWMAMRRSAIALLAAALGGCGAPGEILDEEGPLASRARRIAADEGVPRDLLIAVAAVEGGLRLPPARTFREDD